MAAGLAWRYGRRSRIQLVLVLAAAWIVTEWLRATMFTGFAWNPVGVALLPTGVSRTATLIGTYGLSGVALLIAGIIFLLQGREGRPALGVFVGLAVLSGAAWILDPAPLPAPGVPIRIVQPNIGQQDKWQEGFADRNFAILKGLTRTTDPSPRLILWPEAAVTDPLQNEIERRFYQTQVRLLRRDIAALLRPGDLLLTGGVTWGSTNGLDLTSATNSVFAMDRTGRILARYDKAHLVPYGEYLPMRSILEPLGLSRLAPGDVDFEFGPGPQTLALPVAGKVGFQLCYEIIFSGNVVDPSNRPAFIFNPSNDAWFGRFGPPQHLAQARLRALEEGLPVLRSTPTGISAAVDADGRLLHSLPWRKPGVIDATLPAPKPPTLFARVGNVLPFLLALLLAGIAIAVRRKER
jgi:apolipoprotein N-acyltransferase